MLDESACAGERIQLRSLDVHLDISGLRSPKNFIEDDAIDLHFSFSDTRRFTTLGRKGYDAGGRANRRLPHSDQVSLGQQRHGFLEFCEVGGVGLECVYVVEGRFRLFQKALDAVPVVGAAVDENLRAGERTKFQRGLSSVLHGIRHGIEVAKHTPP